MTNFLLFKIGKLAIYIGPYKLAFNDCEAVLMDTFEESEMIEE